MVNGAFRTCSGPDAKKDGVAASAPPPAGRISKCWRRTGAGVNLHLLADSRGAPTDLQRAHGCWRGKAGRESDAVAGIRVILRRKQQCRGDVKVLPYRVEGVFGLNILEVSSCLCWTLCASARRTIATTRVSPSHVVSPEIWRLLLMLWTIGCLVSCPLISSAAAMRCTSTAASHCLSCGCCECVSAPRCRPLFANGVSHA